MEGGRRVRARVSAREGGERGRRRPRSRHTAGAPARGPLRAVQGRAGLACSGARMARAGLRGPANGRRRRASGRHVYSAERPGGARATARAACSSPARPRMHRRQTGMPARASEAGGRPPRVPAGTCDGGPRRAPGGRGRGVKPRGPPARIAGGTHLHEVVASVDAHHDALRGRHDGQRERCGEEEAAHLELVRRRRARAAAARRKTRPHFLSPSCPKMSARKPAPAFNVDAVVPSGDFTKVSLASLIAGGKYGAFPPQLSPRDGPPHAPPDGPPLGSACVTACLARACGHGSAVAVPSAGGGPIARR
jgi:hypothetical protein